MKKAFLIAITFFIILPFTEAQSLVTRGPYLNMGTPESVVVRWRTNVSEKGVIQYGTDISNLQFRVEENNATREHEINVKGLSPNTKYYYQVGNSNEMLTINDGSYHFKTSPLPGTVQPVRFWAMGDFGNGSKAQRDVRDGYIKYFEDKYTDLWIWLGDNAYSDGTQDEYQKKVFEVYPNELRRMIVWPTPGNHDYGSIDLANKGPYFDIFSLPTKGEAGGKPSTVEAYYSFDYANIHFISINTEYLPYIINNNNVFTQWLEADLRENTNKDWIIAFWHQPPYSKGTHDSDDFFSRMEMTRKHVNPILEKYGVDLVMNGHSHGYERSYLINGHYGSSNTFNPVKMLVNGSNGNPNDGNTYTKWLEGPEKGKGTVYVVAGSGGQKGSGRSSLNHPVMFMSTESYHGSLVVDVDGMFLRARFIDTTGAVIDEFAIQKRSSSTGISLSPNDRIIQIETYPNPFRESFHISFYLEKEEWMEFDIRSIHGQLMDKIEGKVYPSGKNTIVIQANDRYPKGYYLVEMKTSDQLGARRMLRVD